MSAQGLTARRHSSTDRELTPVTAIRYDDRAGGRATRLVAPVVTMLVVLALWTLISTQFLDPGRQFLLPSPIKVIEEGFLNAAARSEILTALWSTTRVALIGLAIAMALGVGLAVLMSQARWIEASLYPYAVILQTIPILAMVPLLGFWFGYELGARVIVCVLISLFPIITNALFGLRSVDASLHDQFSLCGASRLQRLTRLQLPAALPAAVTGFKISAGLSVVGSIIADFFFRQGQPGIGRLIDTYRQSLEMDRMLAALVVSSAIGVVLFLAFDLLLRRIEGRRGPSRR